MSDMTGKRIYEYKIHRRDEGDVNAVTLSINLAPSGYSYASVRSSISSLKELQRV